MIFFVEAGKLSIIHVNNIVDNTFMQTLVSGCPTVWVISPKYNFVTGATRGAEVARLFSSAICSECVEKRGGSATNSTRCR